MNFLPLLLLSCARKRGKKIQSRSQADYNWAINLISLIKWENKHLKNIHGTFNALSLSFLMQTINFDSPRGGISLVTEKGVLTTSRLLVQKAIPSDSGMH